MPALGAYVEPFVAESRRSAVRLSSRLGRGRLPWAEPLVAVLAVALFGWGVWRPGPWRDEATTLVVCRRSLGEIAALMHTTDLVHAVYYTVAHAVLQVSDTLTAVRLVSVIASTGTAVLLVRIGRRLGSASLGLLAAFLLLTMPPMSRFAQEARSTALVTFLGATATVVLLAAVASPARRLPWLRYGLATLLLGLTSVLGLLLLAVHAVIVAVSADRRGVRTWTVTVVVTLLVLSPFLLAASSQQGQLWWLAPPHLGFGLSRAGNRIVAATGLIVLLVITAVAVHLVQRAPGLRPVVVGLSWTVLPAGVLWTVSQWRPLWLGRYLVPVLPGAALVAGWAILGVGRWLRGDFRPSARRLPFAPALVATAAVAGLATLSLPKQAAIRSPLGHSEDVRQVSAYLAQAARPGDGVLYLPDDLRIIGLLNPERVATLDDVALGQTAAESATISGRDAAPAAVARRLASRTRIWVIRIGGFIHDGEGSSDPAKAEALNSSFRRESSTPAGGFSVDLYRRVS